MAEENFLSQVPAASALFLREAEVRRGIEYLFFGHAALWRTIDARLAENSLGRAHYRALYFIARAPGLTISDLLALLGITKQSLGRVVKELEARDLLTTRPGNRDRRQKELRLTSAGRQIEGAIFTLLRDAMSRAYTHAGQAAVTGFWQVNEALLPPGDRGRVARLGREGG
ncbi:MarR family transcriptional regulator [Sphingopyxis indica]|uniref:DNA-binding transcriptional regulator, MarR family n=1 Tax=Sphingopyxis indica TaxID=436663 RepID=A0A239G968_9SPHN|nr:MarR family transcriptional regulator [Sphingopyxis indica]WOF44128.1 MarR family transcriptional regulator [Sphingopyxis indica]SNS65641.1 DNA-binding transcriptional regulator, MarR family [Sphingopyxis indica]